MTALTSPSQRTTGRPVERAVTARLLSRYDRPGPRYTSYPTAVEFHDGITHEDYLRCLDAANALGDAPLALYAHLPFCEERCLFCGCHTIISKRKDVAEPYLELLRREIELLAARLPNRSSSLVSPAQTANAQSSTAKTRPRPLR